MEKLSMEFKQYEKEIKKHNLYLSDFDTLDINYTITLQEDTYKKLGRKNFPKKATETKIEIISARQYACYMTSIGFFKDRVTNSYTELGYKPTTLSCTSPNNETKIVRHFNIRMNK